MHPEDEEYLIHQAQNANMMDQFGSDLAHADVGSDERRREQRIKRGECPTCRRKTHRVSRNPFGRKREPLTIEGEVINGHCLRCEPIEGYITRPKKPTIPDTLEVPDRSGMELVTCEDEMTVASEITMDPYLERGGNAGYASSFGRANQLASHFESVEEEEPMTNFGKRAEEIAGNVDELERERMERERAILEEEAVSHRYSNRSRRGAGDNITPAGRLRLSGRSRISEEDSEDSDEDDDEELWENHEHLLRHMENHQKHQHYEERRDQIQNFQFSENSSIYEPKDDREFSDDKLGSSGLLSSGISNDTGTTPVGRHDSGGDGLSMKQKFHPLSRMAHMYNSERSISLNDASVTSRESSGVHGDDGSETDRILRLCQGSRSSIIFDALEKQSLVAAGERSPTRDRDESPLTKRIPPNEGERRGSSNSKQGPSPSRRKSRNRDDSNRFSLKRLSDTGEVDLDESKKSVNRLSVSERTGGERKVGQAKEGNRFSLTRLDSKGKRLSEGSNSDSRFSFDGPRRRCTMGDRVHPNLQMEMNASKNWDSMDILRDAAAEANGEDLDAAVDALFGLVGSNKEKDEEPSRNDSDRISTEEDDDTDPENVILALSRESSAREEAAIATTIAQRRRSVSSPDNGGAIKLSTVKDIPAIIQTVRSRPKDKKCTERAFQSLFLLATDPDPEGAMARREILANKGMETLVSAIWDHMQNAQVLLALFHALWAISVFNGNDSEDMDKSVSEIEKCGVFEGLLFAMQSHAEDMSIQESGCDLITRLTGLLPNNTPEFKSAVVLLSSNIQTMDTDTKAYSSSLDALNSLCQLSDDSKREFAKAGTDCHSAIIRGLGAESPSLETRELACQLFWCVTSDRTAVSVLSKDGVLSKKIIDALKGVPRSKSSVHFYGAACGTLANLALDPKNHSEMIELGVVAILCDAIYVYSFSEDVISAACTAMANLSASRDIRNLIVSSGGITAIFSAMKSMSDNADVQSEAFRALHNLCESSLEVKRAILTELESIINAFNHHEEVKYIQQIICSILCRLSADEKCRETMTSQPSTYSALVKIMKSNSKKKLVQKAACATLRNLSVDEEAIPILLSKGFDSLVIDAMDAYSDCEELQENACCFLMNMGENSPEASVEICSGEGIHSIVKSMQNIPTSASLQRASCGALYAITNGDAHKVMAVSAGAVDAVIYLMLIHPTDIKVLENAVNVLANLSSLKKCTKPIADSGGITTVIETMRSNPSSTGVILSGSRFIQNMALSDREYANEALGGISPMLGCMDEHPDCAKLVEEACKALRCLVLKSESCKDRVINKNGVAVIEKTMEQNSKSQRWQTLLLDELFQ